MMELGSIIFGTVVIPESPGFGPSGKLALNDFLFLMLSLLIIGLGLFVWVAYFRVPAKKKRKIIESSRSNQTKNETSQIESRKKRKRRKRTHRKSNPTLSESGGLPSERSEENPQSLS